MREESFMLRDAKEDERAKIRIEMPDGEIVESTEFVVMYRDDNDMVCASFASTESVLNAVDVCLDGTVRMIKHLPIVERIIARIALTNIVKDRIGGGIL